MIFVTVGTHEQQFDRLIKKVDEISAKNKHEFIVQLGYSNYKPKNIKKTYKFIPYDETLNIIKNSDIIITHCGIGTVLSCIRYKKPIIVVPRQRRFNEHTNDHQMQLAKVLENDKKAICIYDINYLERAIKSVKKLKIKSYKQGNIVQKILKFIDNLGD
ncbi:MAG: beta-1,4-galactosyltransferase [Candidatus Aenigmarchaeota archaeon]|nr:beta-1,4-galactosyltransferase [Candidatus Aenigmarchaeota archaeon]